MHESLIDAFGFCTNNRSIVWLTLAVIVTKAEQTKERVGTSKEKEHHCWH